MCYKNEGNFALGVYNGIFPLPNHPKLYSRIIGAYIRRNKPSAFHARILDYTVYLLPSFRGKFLGRSNLHLR